VATNEIAGSSNSTSEAQPNQKRQRPQFVPGEVWYDSKRIVLSRARPSRSSELRPINQTTNQKADSWPEPHRRNKSRKLDRFEAPISSRACACSHAPADTIRAIAALQARDDVLYAEPNYVRYLDANPTILSSINYGLTKIGAPQVWDITTAAKT